MVARELGKPPTGPTRLRTDNQSAIAIVKDPKFHMRTKHIDVRYHFIRALVRTGKVEITYVPTDDNLADVLTKALPCAKFEGARTSIGVLPA